MGIFNSLKRKLKKSKEIKTAERTKSAITTSPQKTKRETKRLSPPKPQASARVEKAKILEGYKIKDASAHNWQDESSRKAEVRLKEKGIQLPWHYNDTFGEDFKVLALRAGGVGAVFFVKSTRFGEERIYAAKTLQRFLQRDYLEMPTYQQKKIADDFLEEALPWLEMGQHPNIVPVHLLENVIHPTTRRNVPFVFSEFMEKGDLKNLVAEKGKFSLEEALSAGLQVCEVLLHAYKHGLSAHKDLKPENIMVYREGIYKVTDFSAGVIGTPGYMAPEQVASHFELQDNIAIDQRADQFAIGIIMLELLLGEHPFPWIIRPAYSKEEAGKFLREGVDAGEIPDDLPGSLREKIARCLSTDPDRRFHEISSLKNALLEVYRTEFGEYRFPEVEIDDSPEWWFNRGLAFHNIGRDADAINPLEKALGVFKGIPGTEKEQILCLINIGSAYTCTSRFYEAEENYKEALRILESIPEAVIERAICLLDFGGIHLSTGRLYEAEDNLKDALRMFKMRPETEKEQAGCLLNLGLIYRRIGNHYEAENNFKNALMMFKVKPGTEIDQARCLLYLGNIHQYIRDANQSIDKFYEAEGNYEEALKILKPIPGTEVEQARCLVNLGVVYEDLGEFFKAEESYKEAVMVFEEIQGMEISQARCLMNLGILYNKIQEFGKARSVLKDALEICERYPQGTEQIKNACLQLLSQLP
ncbi:MAG: serine/threonine-protein kinase [Methanophagales archaeon]|nr:serine/threonine-protein kinase [Methanophagales archaeon]